MTTAATRTTEASPSRLPVRVTPNLFGISFGLAGLAAAWAVARPVLSVPGWLVAVLWLLAAAVWLGTVAGYAVDVVRRRRLGADLADPVLGPFLALPAIVAMLLGDALAQHAHRAGEVVALAAVAVTAVLGAWITGGWIVADQQLQQWHPGYFLPTVAGGLVAATVTADLGHRQLAVVLFGYGTVCWLVLGSILLLRLFTQPRLPAPLLPTMAIEVAPPVVAGNAWFAINGGTADAVALLLAGYAFLMVVVQLRLVPVYRTAPFGPAFWSFSFAYAAVAAVALHWLDVQRPAGAAGWSWAVLALLSAGYLALGTRTVLGLVRGTFLPRAVR